MEESTTQNFGYVDPQKRARNARNISIVTAVLLTLSLIATLIFGAFAFVGINTISLITSVLCILAAGLSVWLNRRERSDLGIGILITALILKTASDVFFVKGQAIPTGVSSIIIVSAIAILSLPQKWVSRALIASFIVIVPTIILDQYTTDIPLSPIPTAATVISLILGMAYLIIIATQFQYFPLRTKLITIFLLLTVLPLIVLGWRTYSTTHDIVEKQIKADILRSSLTTSAEYQSYLDSQFSLIRTQARAAEIVDYLSLPPAQRRNSAQEALANERLDTFNKNKPSYFNSFAVLDKDGVDILDTNESMIGTSFADQEFFKNVIDTNNHYASGLTLAPDGSRIAYFATPIPSKSGELSGVYVVTYNPNILQSTMDRLLRTSQITPSLTEYAQVVDGRNYFVLAHSNRVNQVYKTYLGMNDARLAKLQEQAGISQDQLSSLVVPQPEVVAELDQMDLNGNFQAPAYNDEITESAAVRLPNSDWIVVTSQPTSTISGIIANQTRTNVIVSIIITVLAALIAVLASNFFTSPIIQLTQVAETISAGDLTQKADIRRHDELGILARTFNTMTNQIQGLVVNLESRVEQRTADLEQRTSDLEQATAQSNKRAGQLETIADISRYISVEKDPEKLLPLITQIVSERFKFYHVGIFLLDQKGKFAELRAANSAGGQIMLRRHHKLEVGQTGIVGNVTSTGKPRIALDTGADASYFNNPDLPETRSEMALPLTARGTIIGALDVQSTMANAFTNEDVSILTLLADQVAIAIDNVRLLTEAQDALAESQSVFSEYLADAWQKKSESAITGYYQSLSGGKLITAQSQDNEINIPANHKDSAIAIPILVRDQVIGTLNILPNDDSRKWSADEVNIAQAVTERLGLALDNARLFEETSTRASRERLVSDITTRIRGTNDPQEMIKTAMEELQRALGATRVEIVPQKISNPTDK